MTDHTELKLAAEAASQGRWNQDGFDVQNDDINDYRVARCNRLADAKFIAAANPAAVLALIAENERLKTLRSVTERDLAQELEVWRNGPSCWNCGDTGDVHDIVGEWRGKCDCNAAKLIDVSYERDQLCAEVDRIRTGYEAYERVNAELKAEVEKLRKERDARHPFKPFHEPSIGFTGCVICGVYTDHGGLPCPKTRATAYAGLGQGEQS